MSSLVPTCVRHWLKLPIQRDLVGLSLTRQCKPFANPQGARNREVPKPRTPESSLVTPFLMVPGIALLVMASCDSSVSDGHGSVPDGHGSVPDGSWGRCVPDCSWDGSVPDGSCDDSVLDGSYDSSIPDGFCAAPFLIVLVRLRS